jgi:hypothetical protein
MTALADKTIQEYSPWEYCQEAGQIKTPPETGGVSIDPIADAIKSERS